ncbi:hypothetical protein ACN47E_005395 [Coniothyrium glycines]
MEQAARSPALSPPVWQIGAQQQQAAHTEGGHYSTWAFSAITLLHRSALIHPCPPRKRTMLSEHPPQPQSPLSPNDFMTQKKNRYRVGRTSLRRILIGPAAQE